MGGLGNQLFQYAFGKTLASKNNCPLYLDLRHFEQNKLHSGYALDCYNIQATIADNSLLNDYQEWKLRLSSKLSGVLPCSFGHYHEPEFSYSETNLNAPQNKILVGYWQSEKYFSQIEDTLRRDLTPSNEIVERNQDYRSLIGERNAVSVHVRRGDYLTNPNAASLYEECGVDYYQRALEYINQKTQNPVFFIFSDDIDWCRSNLTFPGEHHFVSGEAKGPHDDLYLMSQCRHHIIANSTFSWWGAWLSTAVEKLVISPKKWFKDGKLSCNDLTNRDWVRI